MAATWMVWGPVLVLAKATFWATLRARATERQSLMCRRLDVPRPRPKLSPVDGSANAVIPMAAPAATAARRLVVSLFMVGGCFLSEGDAEVRVPFVRTHLEKP